MNILISLAFIICMSWFGFTFVYCLTVVRKNSDEKVNSFSLVNDINQLGKIHKKFLAIKKKNNPNTILPKVLVITNVISFLMFAGLFLLLLIRSIMLDIM